MLEKDYTTKLLGMEEVIVKNIINEEKIIHVYIEQPRKEHICPCCKCRTDRIHDYREQAIKDIEIQGKAVLLHFRKRRYCCPMCGKRFFEKNEIVARYYRITKRAMAYGIQLFHRLLSAKEIADRMHVSITTALRYFDMISYHPKELPEVLSIDEFKGNAGGEKYQSIIADAQNHKVIDILPNRYESDLIRYFSQFPSRMQVKCFVSDMNPHFRNVAQKCFPNAILIVDRFHVIRQAVWAMEHIRKNEQKRLSDRFRKYFKHSRYLLSKPFEQLNNDEMDRLALMFEISPKLADAYRMKNEFVRIVMSKNPTTGRKALADWICDVEAMELPEFRDCLKACRHWFAEICNAMAFPWSNGFTEGCNNKTKVLKRVCYGVQNFNRFRNRILHCMA